MMNKRDYVNLLLRLCTSAQKELFGRLYPEGVQPRQLDHAIFQIENTLRDLNEVNQELRDTKTELGKAKDELVVKTIEFEKELAEKENELQRAFRTITAYNNPVDIENAEVQEKLQLLEALQASGVDNWAWYGEATKDL